MQVTRGAEVREDAIAGPGNLGAEREAETAQAVLLERDEIARKRHFVRADLSGRRAGGEAGESEVERRVRDRQEDRVARLWRGVETVRVGDAAAEAEASRTRRFFVEVGEDELARPVSGEAEFLDLGGGIGDGEPLSGQHDGRRSRCGERHRGRSQSVNPRLKRPEERKAVAGPRELEEEVAGVKVEVRASGGPVIVDETVEDLAERSQLQEEDLDGIEAGALLREEDPSGRRRCPDEPRPARGELPARPCIPDREFLPGPAAERVGERFEVEGGRHRHEERRPVESQRREELPDRRASGDVRGPRRLRGLVADQSCRLLLGEDVAKRAPQVVEKLGGRADGRARRADPRRRVDRRRLGFRAQRSHQTKRSRDEAKAGRPVRASQASSRQSESGLLQPGQGGTKNERPARE